MAEEYRLLTKELIYQKPPKSIDLSQITKDEFDAQMEKAWQEMINGSGKSLEEFEAEYK